MRWLKIQKFENFDNGTQPSYKVKTFLVNLCLRWHILRSYCFVVEVTFKVYNVINTLNKNLITYCYFVWEGKSREGKKVWTLQLFQLIKY